MVVEIIDYETVNSPESQYNELISQVKDLQIKKPNENAIDHTKDQDFKIER